MTGWNSGRETENGAGRCLSLGWENMAFAPFVSWMVPILHPLSWGLSTMVLLHVRFLSPLPQRWSLWPSSCSPVLAPILQSSLSPPQTSVHVTGEGTVTFPRHFPSHSVSPFAPGRSHIVRSASRHSSSSSTLVCHPLSLFLFPFSLRLSPLTAALFFPPTLYPLFISLKPPPSPFSPLICSFLTPFFFFPVYGSCFLSFYTIPFIFVPCSFRHLSHQTLEATAFFFFLDSVFPHTYNNIHDLLNFLVSVNLSIDGTRLSESHPLLHLTSPSRRASCTGCLLQHLFISLSFYSPL